MSAPQNKTCILSHYTNIFVIMQGFRLREAVQEAFWLFGQQDTQNDPIQQNPAQNRGMVT